VRRQKGVLCILLSLLFLPAFASGGTPLRIRKVGKVPNFIVLSRDGAKIYATSYATGQLLEIDLGRQIVTRSVVVGDAPLGLAIVEEGKTALVACRDSGTVVAVDLESFGVLADISVGAKPNSVAIDARGYRAYAVDYGRSREGRLHIIDIRERKVVGSIKLGASPFGLVVSPTTELVFVLMGGDNEVWVIDPTREAVVNKIPVGEGPDGIAITPDGKRVFVANSRTNDLSIIDTQLMRVQVTIPIGKMPFGVTVSPDGKRVFVVNVDSRNVSILPTDLSSLTGETFPVDKGSTDIQVGSNNRTIYVVSESTNSILITDIP
jgi:YVTN family beta-propeller protein